MFDTSLDVRLGTVPEAMLLMHSLEAMLFLASREATNRRLPEKAIRSIRRVPWHQKEIAITTNRIEKAKHRRRIFHENLKFGDRFEFTIEF